MIFNRLFTKNYTEVPLLYLNFNHKYFKSKGKKNSCMLHLHPCLREDQHIIDTMNNLVDYIRDNYDMDKII